MKSEIAIEVAASPATLFQLARDVARWPDLLPHYRRVTVRRQSGDRVLADMVAVRRFGPVPVPVTWRAEQWSDGSDEADMRLEFRHVRGVTRGMAVTWHIRPTADGARIIIAHDFSRRLPLVGERPLPWVVDRFFVRPIAGRTLATFKALAERAA